MRYFTIAIMVLALIISGCGKKAEQQPGTTTTEAQPSGGQVEAGKMVMTASGLNYQDVVIGDGAEAVAGRTVKVHYTGWLEDGSKFDSSLDRNRPFEFPLGAGRVIRGWDEGVAGMKVGGKRILLIPPELGYGERGVPGTIPPNAVLKFEVELLEVM